MITDDVTIYAIVLGAFYYLLGNLQPKFRQRINNIQLLGLVKSSVIQEHGMNNILEFLLQDVNKLEEVSLVHELHSVNDTCKYVYTPTQSKILSCFNYIQTCHMCTFHFFRELISVI